MKRISTFLRNRNKQILIFHKAGPFTCKVFVTQCPVCTGTSDAHQGLTTANLMEFEADHSRYEWMGVYSAVPRAARQIPFSSLQGNDPFLWLY